MPTERKFLIVDDELEWQKHHGNLLTRNGIKFITVGNASDALVEIRKGGITDIIVDGLGENDDCKTVVENSEGSRVTIVSASEDKKLLARTLKVGFIDKTNYLEERDQLVDVSL